MSGTQLHTREVIICQEKLRGGEKISRFVPAFALIRAGRGRGRRNEIVPAPIAAAVERPDESSATSRLF